MARRAGERRDGRGGPAMTDQHLGTLAEEAGLLLDAVAARLEAAKGRAEEPARPVCPSCGHDPAASCTSCPLCRLLAVLRGERPEVTARWTESALTVVQALRTAIAPPGEPADPSAEAEPTGTQGQAGTSATGRPTGLQHIHIR